jgi:hypothetical protein
MGDHSDICIIFIAWEVLSARHANLQGKAGGFFESRLRDVI